MVSHFPTVFPLTLTPHRTDEHVDEQDVGHQQEHGHQHGRDPAPGHTVRAFVPARVNLARVHLPVQHEVGLTVSGKIFK